MPYRFSIKIMAHLFSLLLLILIFNPHTARAFNSIEHKWIGDVIKLHIPTNLQSPSDDTVKEVVAGDYDLFTFTYRNKTYPITYGDLIAIPDYFGSREPLSSSSYNPDELAMNADRWFFTVWQNTNEYTEHASEDDTLYAMGRELLAKVKDIYAEEWAYVKETVPTPLDPFDNWPSEEDALNIITKGQPLSPYPIPGTYLSLESVNLDHIGSDALKAWAAMHIYALRTVKEAARLESLSLYKKALAIEAFGDHFFSDTFSSGHVRVPRRLLWQYYGDMCGGGIVRQMHNEDCKYGLWVSNKAGHRWRAYGDGRLFCHYNEENKRMVVDAVQKTANSIWSAFKEFSECFKNCAASYTSGQRNEHGRRLPVLEMCDCEDVEIKYRGVAMDLTPVHAGFNLNNTSPMYTWNETGQVYHRMPTSGLYASEGYAPDTKKGYWGCALMYMSRGRKYDPVFNGAFCDESTPCLNGNTCGAYNTSIPNSCGPPYGFEYPTQCNGRLPNYRPR